MTMLRSGVGGSVSLRKMLEVENTGFQPEGQVLSFLPTLPYPDVVILTGCSKHTPLSRSDRAMWPSSGQCGVRGLLGASGTGFLAPRKRHEEKTAPFSPLDVECGCLLGSVAAILRP